MHYRETSLLIFLFCLLNYDLVHCAEERRVMRDLQQNCTSAACPGISIHCPATSCFEVLKCNSLSPSGYYWIRTSSCVQRMYCKMEKITCNFPGSCAEYPAESCRSIFECDPLITSGDYWIKTSSSPHAQRRYCNISCYNEGYHILTPASSCYSIYNCDPTNDIDRTCLDICFRSTRSQ